jgi:hypothetical protein
MQITKIDQYLYQITDILPASLLAELQAVNWLDWPYPQDAIEETNRKSLTVTGVLEQVNQYIIDITPIIQQHVGITFNNPPRLANTVWWLDTENFTSAMHSDTDIAATMQLYWHGADTLGTIFFEENGVTIKKYFVFEPNTGYLVLNQNSNPALRTVTNLHHMPTPVPAGQYRVSSYTGFTDYTDK